ncbi:MAG TPA: TonB-dependent receptor [Puia sp.]|nr:TonB-dependent receptor [Puia sp.]
MKALSLTALLSWLFCQAWPQTSHPLINLKGTIVDSSSGKPLAFATLVLQNAKTKAPVKNFISKDDGSFEFSVSDSLDWLLVIAFTGYDNKTVPIKKGKSTDLGQVSLKASGKQMNEVTVVAVKPVIKRDLDGITYDVSADPESPVLDALDLMRKVPLLSVDASDNIKLKGKSNYKILINGKESALMAKNPSDVLRSMPATNIERIEVITTPPAKYDAEGLAGIINIITKKKLDEGYNIGVNGRLNTVWGPGINLNGTFKQGKFGFSGYMGYNVRHSQTNGIGGEQDFFSDKSSLVQQGTNTAAAHNTYGNIELSYEFDSLDLLTGSFEFYSGNYSQDGNQLSNFYDSTKTITQAYRLMSDASNGFGGMDASLNYQRGFRKDKNRLLTLSYKYSYSPNTQNVNNTVSDTFNFYLPDYKQNNHAGNSEHTIQLDYVHPFKTVNLEAGAKTILRNNFSNYESSNYNDVTKEYEINPSQTNDFSYDQDIYSIYNSYSAKWDKWNAKAGLRLEHTTVNADFVSSSSTVKQDYNNLIPSLSVQRNLKTSSISLGYTDRISRPGIYQLNPFVDLSNPNFITTGNPNLQPEINHTFELNYSTFSKNSITAGISYAFSNNSIQTVTHLQAVSNGNLIDTTTVTTYQNLGSNKTLGLNLNINFTSVKNLSISLNSQLAHVWLKGTYNSQFYTNDGYTGNAFLNMGFKFGNGYRIGFDAGYFSGDVNLQGKTSAYIFNSYVFSKTFFNKRLTLSAVMNNPYSQFFTFRSTTTTPDFYQSNYNQIFYRNFALRFNFKFGKLNSDIKRNQRGINNDDKKAGKSSTPGS